MQFRVLLDAEPKSQVPQRFSQQFRIGFGIQLGHFGKPDGGFLPRVGFFTVRASRIILKNTDGFRDVPVLDQLANVGLHVARRDTPRLSRKQHGALTALRHRRPKLFVENFAMRLREDARFAHFVFMSAENLSQILDFLVHAVEHLANRIDFHFAAFEALQREANRQLFRQLHEHGLIRPGIRRLRRQGRERLLQCVLRAARQLRTCD